MNLNNLFNEEKVRLDPACWHNKKIGNPKTKMKGGTRVNNCVPKESVEEAREIRNKKGRLLGTWDGREFTMDPDTQAWLIDELGPEGAEQWVDNKTAELRKQSAPSEDRVKYYANELEKSDAQAGRPRQSRQQYYDLAVQMLSDQQGLAEEESEAAAQRKQYPSYYQHKDAGTIFRTQNDAGQTMNITPDDEEWDDYYRQQFPDMSTPNDEIPIRYNVDGTAVMVEGSAEKVVFSGQGADGGTYEIIQSGPTDFMIHANGKHIDTYGSLQRAMSVLKNEVPGLQQGMAEGSTEQVYKVLAVDKSNALSKQVKLKVKASSLDEVFERLAINDWYPLEINGVEVINGKRLKQGVAEGSELKQAKRKYNQAAKDANADQVGAGKKIDTMKNSLRQRDLNKQGMAEDDGFDDVSNYTDMRTTDTGNKSNQTYTSTAIAKNSATGQQKSLASWDHTDPKTGKNYSGSNYIDAQGNAEVQKNYEESKNKVNEVSLGDYGKKAPVSRAGAEIKKFFGRDDPAAVAAADRTIANRTKGLARADARRKPYTAPPVDQDKQRQQLTDKYPNIDQLVRRAEVNRDPNYEYADGQAYYDGQEAEQKYQRLKQIQRIIQGLNESKTLADYMKEAKGVNSIRNPYDLQPLEGGGGGGGGGGYTGGPSPFRGIFGPKPGSREASIAQPNPNTMTIKQGPNPDYRPPSQQSQTTGDKPKIKVNPGETVPQAIERTKTQQEFGKFLQGQSGQTFGAGAGRGSVNPAPANTMANTPVSVKNKPSAMNSMAKDLTNPPKSSNTNTNTNTNTTTNNSPRQNDRVDPLDVYMPRSTAQDPFMPRDPFDMVRPGYDGQLGSNPMPNTRNKQSSWLGKAGKTLGYGAAAYGAADVGSRAWDYYDQTKDMPSVKEAKKQSPEVEYDDEYDAMVARVKKLAGLGPMKTVYDPKKRQYRNMPTAQQPKK